LYSSAEALTKLAEVRTVEVEVDPSNSINIPVQAKILSSPTKKIVP
jgi:hypothetical protein